MCTGPGSGATPPAVCLSACNPVTGPAPLPHRPFCGEYSFPASHPAPDPDRSPNHTRIGTRSGTRHPARHGGNSARATPHPHRCAIIDDPPGTRCELYRREDRPGNRRYGGAQKRLFDLLLLLDGFEQEHAGRRPGRDCFDTEIAARGIGTGSSAGNRPENHPGTGAVPVSRWGKPGKGRGGSIPPVLRSFVR